MRFFLTGRVGAAWRCWRAGVWSWARVLVWLCAGLCAGLGAGAAQAQTDAAESTDARFAIDLQAPADLHSFLLRQLDLQRFRSLRDLDANELERLVQAVPDNLRSLLCTFGSILGC